MATGVAAGHVTTLTHADAPALLHVGTNRSRLPFQPFPSCPVMPLHSSMLEQIAPVIPQALF